MNRLLVFASLTVSLLAMGCDSPTSESTANKGESSSTEGAPMQSAQPSNNPCTADIQNLCPGVQQPKDVVDCLREHKDQVSEACVAYVKI